MYIFSLLDAKEQLVDDDGILNDIKVQIITNLCKCLLYSAPGSTTRTMALCALKLESFFHRLIILYCFSSLIKTSSYIIINDMTNTLAQNLYLIYVTTLMISISLYTYTITFFGESRLPQDCSEYLLFEICINHSTTFNLNVRMSSSVTRSFKMIY